jgi:hypothetical protein
LENGGLEITTLETTRQIGPLCERYPALLYPDSA